MERYTPASDGLTDQQFIAACDSSGFVATAAALRRAVATVRRAYFRLTLPYEIRCDDCKRVIERTDSLHESACGGRCFECRQAMRVVK